MTDTYPIPSPPPPPSYQRRSTGKLPNDKTDYPFSPIQSSDRRYSDVSSFSYVSQIVSQPLPNIAPPTAAQLAQILPPKAKQKVASMSKSTRSRKAVRDFRKKSSEVGSVPTIWKGRITVHTVVYSIDIKELYRTVAEDKMGVWEAKDDHYDVIHLTYRNLKIDPESSEFPNESDSSHAETPQIFVFSFGAVVFWNVGDDDSTAEKEWLQEYLFKQPDLRGEILDARAAEAAGDEIVFAYRDNTIDLGASSSSINDTPATATMGGTEGAGEVGRGGGRDPSLRFTMRRESVNLETFAAGEKLAVSFALAKSSLLSVYEWELEQSIERHSDIPMHLADTGEVGLTNHELKKEIGSVFLIENGITLDNLHDTPEEFLDNDRFKQTYEDALKYFGMEKRLRLVNYRLLMIQDLHVVLRSENHKKHDLELEWIIIILILVDVVCKFVRPILYSQIYKLTGGGGS